MVTFDGDVVKRIFVKDTLYVGNLSLTKDAGSITTTETHGMDIVYAGTYTTGGVVGLNVITTGKGTASNWSAAAYFQFVLATTNYVTGYAVAGEFEIKTSGTANAGDVACIMLDSNVSRAGSECQSYIMLQDFGTQATNNFLYGMGIATATADATKLFSTAAAPRTHTHSLRIRMGATPYWIMCSTTGA